VCQAGLETGSRPLCQVLVLRSRGRGTIVRRGGGYGTRRIGCCAGGCRGLLCRPTVRSRRPVGSSGTPTHGTRASWGSRRQRPSTSSYARACHRRGRCRRRLRCRLSREHQCSQRVGKRKRGSQARLFDSLLMTRIQANCSAMPGGWRGDGGHFAPAGLRAFEVEFSLLGDTDSWKNGAVGRANTSEHRKY